MLRIYSTKYYRRFMLADLWRRKWLLMRSKNWIRRLNKIVLIFLACWSFSYFINKSWLHNFSSVFYIIVLCLLCSSLMIHHKHLRMLEMRISIIITLNNDWAIIHLLIIHETSILNTRTWLYLMISIYDISICIIIFSI